MTCTVLVAIRNPSHSLKAQVRPRLYLQDLTTQPRACTQPTSLSRSSSHTSHSHKGEEPHLHLQACVCLRTLKIVPVAALDLSIPVSTRRPRSRTDPGPSLTSPLKTRSASTAHCHPHLSQWKIEVDTLVRACNGYSPRALHRSPTASQDNPHKCKHNIWRHRCTC